MPEHRKLTGTRLVSGLILTAVVLVLAGARPVIGGDAAEVRVKDGSRLSDRSEQLFTISAARRTRDEDPDKDGLRSETELRKGLSPRRADTDRDRLRDDYELYRSRTSARRRDSDGDGDGDGREVRLGTDPLVASPRPPVSEPTRVLHVATSGTDTGAGTAASPFNSIWRALEESSGGELVLVGPGLYPELTDTRARAAPVTIRAATADRPHIAGARLLGAQRLRLESVVFTDKVRISEHGLHGGRQPARDISISGSDLTTGGRESCMQIRSGTSDIRLVGNRIHDCQHGVSGPGFTTRSAGIVIRNNTLENFWADGIAFAHWTDVVIDQNIIRHMNRRSGSNEHNDGIQIFGDSERIRITNNRIYDSSGQLVLIQDPVGGSNDDILVENNLIHAAGAYAVQVIGSTNVRIVNNTIWDSRYGSLLVRKGKSSVVPIDAIVVNNILKSFTTLDGASWRTRSHNLIFRRPTGGAAPHELIGVDPRFEDARNGDYRITRSSPVRARADPMYAPAFDLTGKPRPRRGSFGALNADR